MIDLDELKLLKLEDAAIILNVSLREIERLISAGKILTVEACGKRTTLKLLKLYIEELEQEAILKKQKFLKALSKK